ncbi:hypothetical protein [Microbacterium invictum]|uniref:Uncharacterized protein n=1 Tax=Microbacterium invictum TaxID=515415 RepID=A0ABZ0V602_9MICO|nr:hypothetical protein [Microbacterium invictum]WQB69026.1 hypothetical protein T9R20_09910 [Microbacterium invictum]
MSGYPFERLGAEPPAYLRDLRGTLPAAAEVAHLRHIAVADWIARHSLDVAVEDLLARIAVVGADVATAEALTGSLPRRADVSDHGDV